MMERHVLQYKGPDSVFDGFDDSHLYSFEEILVLTLRMLLANTDFSLTLGHWKSHSMSHSYPQN